MSILDFAPDTSAAPAPGLVAGHVAPRGRDVSAPRTRAVKLHDDLWRVTRPDGEVAGYVERFAESRGIRFRAKRLIVRQQRFVPVGEFWSMDEALAVL